MTQTIAKCDARGRIYLEKPVREKYGKTFLVVQSPDELILMPVPADPLRHIAELGKKLPDLPLAELKKEIRKQAVRDGAGYVRRH